MPSRRAATAWLLALVSCLALVACGGGDTTATRTTPAPTTSQALPTCSPSGTALTIAAKDLKFDKLCLAAPANQPFTITFDNQEQVTHDLSIYPDSSPRAIAMFDGEDFTGPGTKTYRISPIAAGTYQFRCTVHPGLMKGPFVVA